jgi:hypothetical protein
MITKITTVQELKQMFLEIFLNKTDKVTDISQESVLNAIAFGCAKIGQKVLTNLAVAEGHLFPDSAYGNYLDELAKIRGVSDRFTALGSSTYLRIVGDEGTTYNKDTNKFYSSSGITFQLEEDTITIPADGYIYCKIKSLETGLKTNVDPVSINRLDNSPQGHVACTNEYKAQGGIDNEADDLFRTRIKENVNQLARNTISYLEQIFMKINSRVLKIYRGGIDSDSRLNLYIVPVNGVNFTEQEFNEILTQSNEFLSLPELFYSENEFSLKLNNVDWLEVNVDFRVDINPSYDYDVVRKSIQIQIGKLFDYRYWKYGDKIEWDNMLFAVKGVDGVRYVPDASFYPNHDINVPKYKLPRVKGFIMRDLNGNVLSDNANVLNSFYYPNDPDYSYQQTVISSI